MGGGMATDELAIHLQDLMVLVRALERRVIAGDAARDPAQMAKAIVELTGLVETTLVTTAEQRYVLEIVRSLVLLRRPDVALDRLADFLQ
jgi:hypothetical protein